MPHQIGRRDRGAVLPLVLVVSFVLSAVVVAVARFGTTNLRYAELTERRSDQLAAADAAMSYAVNLLELYAAQCIYNDSLISLPPLAESFNGATGTVQCSLSGGGLDSVALFALVITGEGLAPSDYLVETSGGSVKNISGPMFMERVDGPAFDLSNNNGLLLSGAPLVHYDGTTPECEAISEEVLNSDVDFEPDEIFGPICSNSHWYDYGPFNDTFDEPQINASFDPLYWTDPADPTIDAPSGGSVQVYDGDAAATTPPVIVGRDSAADLNRVAIRGAYSDVTLPSGTCRVFEPGRYISPPDADYPNVYFKSGDYLFDFREPTGFGVQPFATWPVPTSIADAEFQMNQTISTAGKPNPDPNGDGVFTDAFTQQIPNDACADHIADDVVLSDAGYGATFYFSGSSHIALNTQAVLEVMPRNKGTVAEPLYVSFHALCDRALTSWCHHSPVSTEVLPSNRTAPGGTPSDPALIWIKAGQVSEIVSNGLIYAPLSELYFKNVANGAEVRILGGAVVARATIDAAASASNLEIGVGSQDIDLDLRLLATGTDPEGGTTQLVSDVDLEYDPALPLDERLEVLSWRVCETSGC